MVNNMDNEIKKAITKAMNKLVRFSLNENKMNGKAIEVALHGRFNHDIWVTSLEHSVIQIIEAPKTIGCIPDFEDKIEKFMAETRVIFHTPAEVLSTLNTEANE